MELNKHRCDIDGIRALAVGLVLLFHADLAFVGGFVGVDVFFVISGYLISHVVTRDITAGTFCFSDFFIRRIRRLFPALAVMIIVSFVTALVLFVPEHLTEMAESVIAQPLLYANFLFWSKTGYFATDAELIPLLHTWSLAVEEQFYLVFPAVMVFLMRRGARSAARAVFFFGVISFVWSVYATMYFPAAGFFLLPSRIWEFNVGILLAFVHRSSGFSDRQKPKPAMCELLALCGIALIVFPAMLYDDRVAFPGIAALPPCLGTALLIHVNHRRLTFVGRALSCSPLTFTGRISYSLYLWHWPVFVFARYVLIGDFSLPMRVLALAACWPIAFLSWRFVETPIRTAGFLPRRAHALIGSCTVSFLLVASAVFVLREEGIPERFPREIYTHRSPTHQIPQFVRYDRIDDPSHLPVIGDDQCSQRPDLLLWGDSHAMSIMPAIDTIGEELQCGVFVAAQPGIPPLVGAWPLRESLQPIDYGESVLKFVEDRGVRRVILAARWNLYVYGDQSGDRSHLICDCQTRSQTTAEAEVVFVNALRQTCRRLRAAGAQVSILRQVPFQPRNAPGTILQLAIQQRDLNSLAVTVDEHTSRFKAINHLLDSVAGDYARFLDPLPFVADESRRCRTAVDGIAIYRDHDHLSAYGALQLEPLLRSVFVKQTVRIQQAQESPDSVRL